MFFEAANLVAVAAFPVNSPVKLEEVTEFKPVKVVAEAPKAMFVVPTVTLELANWPFTIPAVALKLLDEIFERVLAAASMVLLVNDSAPAIVAKVPVDGNVTFVAPTVFKFKAEAPSVEKLPAKAIGVPLILLTIVLD